MTRAAAMLALLLAAGCAAPVTVAAPPPRAVDVFPPGTDLTPEGPAEADTSCDPRAGSLSPRGQLPRPGEMPPGTTMARIQARGRLIAGVDQNLNLFGSRHPHTGVVEGFDIDIVREIAAAILGDPDKVQFRAVNFTNNISVVQSGEVDIVADSMTITCARLADIGMTSDYFDSGQRVLVPKASTVDEIDDLAGQKVCAPSKTTSIKVIAERPVQPPLLPVGVAEWTDCLVLLQQGQVAAVSTTDSVLIGLRAQDPTMKIVGPRFTDEPHGLAVGKGEDEFLRFVNGVLERMRQDGTWTRLHKKWLADLGPAVPPVARYRDQGAP
ncbi:MAG TPA: glutamate ABC transporter substrate-binding protein [Actinokineospora sp.]|nr:glutamate ABC transporter substrate-binding protein [Actinokineospora sp.]